MPTLEPWMKISYVANHAEMTALSRLLVERHRGRVALRFTETGVVAEVEIADQTASANLEEALLAAGVHAQAIAA
jgi:hypothetical protein